MTNMNRRHFLMSTAVLAGGTAVRGLPNVNGTVRMAVVGCGGRGGSHVNGWPRVPNVEIVALCDVDQAHIAAKLKTLESKGLKTPATYVDFRKLLEDKSIDAVSLATPNHWHALQTILGVPGRQGCLRREAVLTQRLRVAADCRGGAEVRPDRPAGQPEPLLTRACGKRSIEWRPASSARSTWRAASATSGATESASTPTARWRPARSSS